MDLNGEGLFRVAPEDGVAATKKTAENVRRGGFEEWPNEAGVSIFPFPCNALIPFLPSSTSSALALISLHGYLSSRSLHLSSTPYLYLLNNKLTIPSSQT